MEKNESFKKYRRKDELFVRAAKIRKVLVYYSEGRRANVEIIGAAKGEFVMISAKVMPKKGDYVVDVSPDEVVMWRSCVLLQKKGI